jgi:16S rRNA (uracil1498-N3)-methyltransferase
VSAPHFFASSVEHDVVTLDGEEADHARRALRIRVGETITVGDGAGTIVHARVESTGDVVKAVVQDRRFIARPAPLLTIFPAVPKSGKLELIVQKLTELGVDAISPWFAERTVVRWDAAKSATHTARLRAVAHSAAKQSRRAWLPVVAEPAPLHALPPNTLVPHETATTPVRDALDPKAVEVGVVIGPEGGLSDEEVERLVALGGRTVSLGENILRAETAAIAALAIAASELAGS